MRRALISTTSLALSLVLVGAGAGTAIAGESPSPSPSPSVSVSPTPTPSPSVSEPDPETSGEPEDEVEAQTALALSPVYTCDEDPSDDFQLPADGDGVTYALENGVFTATLDEGYVWGAIDGWDPWTDKIYEEPPYLLIPEPGTTDPVVRSLADFAFPHCNHNDETTVTVAAECTDGSAYLVYDIDAWWATDETTVRIYPYTTDEAAQGRIGYEGNELSGRLAWDGSTPGMDGPIDGRWGTELFDPQTKVVDDPIFSISTGSGQNAHHALAMLRFDTAYPCSDAAPGDGETGGGSAGADDEELAATGPEAAWITAGVAALLVAAGAALVVVRRRMNA
ncbi:LPXTG cell wall anchor domain-containing protein [Promicromonospora sukumoe]|uniref:LPXTG cell wall anchor domain-containing protein n=1 Tax=Promicromonospora sukumoe TaxID=88382 RepID=UPI00365C2CEF